MLLYLPKYSSRTSRLINDIPASSENFTVWIVELFAAPLMLVTTKILCPPFTESEVAHFVENTLFPVQEIT